MTAGNEELGTAPTPKQVDALVEKYSAAQQVVEGYSTAYDVANAAAGELKAELIKLTQAHGFQHTAKSKKLLGLHSEAMVTTGTRSEVLADKVEKFRGYLAKRFPGLSARFFTEHVSYMMVAGPSAVLKTLELPTKDRTKIEQLVSACFDTKTIAPSLKVTVVPAEVPAKAA